MGYKLEELSPEEGKALTAELQAVLAKYNAEMGTTATITLFKRVEVEEPVVSPVQRDDIMKGNDDSNENKEAA